MKKKFTFALQLLFELVYFKDDFLEEIDKIQTLVSENAEKISFSLPDPPLFRRLKPSLFNDPLKLVVRFFPIILVNIEH